MKTTSEQSERDNMALAAELARQLGHDFSNFVYNLFLQLEIWETVGTPPKPSDWEPIKREGKKVVGMLQEWDHFHCRALAPEAEVDLHALLRQTVSEGSFRDAAVELAPAILAGPLPIQGLTIGTRHLLRLAAEDIFQKAQEATGTVPTLAIETSQPDDKARVRFSSQWTASAPDPDEEPPSKSLIEAACRSLALRLDANVEREQRPDGTYIVQIDFPLNLTGA